MSPQLPDRATIQNWSGTASFVLAVAIALGSLWYKMDSVNHAQNVRIAQIEVQITQFQKDQAEMKELNRDLAKVLNNFSVSIAQLQVTVENNTTVLEKIERQLPLRIQNNK